MTSIHMLLKWNEWSYWQKDSLNDWEFNELNDCFHTISDKFNLNNILHKNKELLNYSYLDYYTVEYKKKIVINHFVNVDKQYN